MGQPNPGGPQYYPPPPPPSRRNVGLIVGLAAAALVVVTILAVAVFLIVDNDGSDGTEGTGSAQLKRPVRFQIVSEIGQPPCQAGMLADLEGKCYRLGSQLMDVTQVKDMRPEAPKPEQGQTGWTLQISFTAADAAKFAEISRTASQNYQQNPGSPGSQIAIVVDGRVLSAPQVVSGPIAGGEVSINGPSTTFTQKYVRDLVDRLSG
ncbi:hypothetical protein J4573_20505 [Actinomadura barringtoniae]|uniref:SecDF P1 head subdomain domain-containing protein n=1 Tax=Actinomadura barringtoniae TaxID=1427535 RepID=A0A939PHY1_9ACTN|nr:hypothetical protein [Actinomadura barringtoniae]MBO2449494.1 hypothetical protein [Actinomadura barringtoniae]